MKKPIFLILLLIVSLSCRKEFPDIGGNGYYLDYNDNEDLCIKQPIKGMAGYDKLIVFGRIEQYAFDENFILVAEKPRDSVPGILNMNLQQYEKIFNQSSFRQYYILNKKNDSLYGPFKKEKFIETRKTLNVPISLKIF